MTRPDEGAPSLAIIAVLFILIGLMLAVLSVPMFIAAYEEYRIHCPEGTTKVECQ